MPCSSVINCSSFKFTFGNNCLNASACAQCVEQILPFSKPVDASMNAPEQILATSAPDLYCCSIQSINNRFPFAALSYVRINVEGMMIRLFVFMDEIFIFG